VKMWYVMKVHVSAMRDIQEVTVVHKIYALE